MKVYVTKYAFSGGVFTIEGELVGDHGKYFKERKPGGGGYFLTMGRDCFASRTDAIAKVTEMQAKKLESLTNQAVTIKRINPEKAVPQEAA